MDQITPQKTLDDFLGVQPPSTAAKFRKWGLIIIAVLAVAYTGWRLFGGSSHPKSYAMEAVTRGNLQVRVTATGNLAPTNQITVGSEISGIVEQVYVEENDHVNKGQKLAQIDTSRALDTIRQSNAALAQAQAGVGQARATVRQTKATLGHFQEVYQLSGGKVPSATEMDTARGDFDRAIANLRAADAQVASARAQLSSNTINLAKATIRSPVNGVVLIRQIEPGQTVAASFNTPTLFTIAEDLSTMQLQVKVDEADVGQVHTGERVRFTVDAFPGRNFPAEITRVNVGANSSTSGSSSSSTVISYNAVLLVHNLDLILRPGMTATASIVASEEKDALLVPNAALRFKPATHAKKPASPFGMPMGPPGSSQRKAKQAQIGRGTRQTVYVLADDGSLRPLQVVAGASNGNLTSVTGGDLKDGMKVITGELATPE